MRRENAWECGVMRINNEASDKGAFFEEMIILMKMVKNGQKISQHFFAIFNRDHRLCAQHPLLSTKPYIVPIFGHQTKRFQRPLETTIHHTTPQPPSPTAFSSHPPTRPSTPTPHPQSHVQCSRKGTFSTPQPTIPRPISSTTTHKLPHIQPKPSQKHFKPQHNSIIPHGVQCHPI